MAAQELLKRRHVRKSLTEWSRYIGFEPADHHLLIIQEIESLLESDEYDTLLIFAPPGSAKSSYVSICLPSWYYARHPRDSVLAASHSTELAAKWGRRVRNLVNEHSKTLGVKLSGDNQAADRWALEDGGEYYAAGVGSGIAGFRADLGIIDDPFGSREDAYSKRIRDKVWDWFLSDFSSRLKPSAKRIVMHTRWHEDDLAGRILERAEQGFYRAKVLSLPAIAGADDPLGRAPGEYLWDDPSGYNYAQYLRDRQRELPPVEWSALYQQQPTPEEGEYFQKDWFRWYDPDNLPPTLRKYGASDYAVTNKGGDYTVHGVVGVDPDDNIYVLDIWREQSSSDRWVDAFIDLVAHHKPIKWAEEQGQIIKSLGPFIDKRMRERRVYCAREQFTSVADKPTRARAFQARASMGKVYLPTSAPWLQDFVAELLMFDAGKHDDQVDVMALIGRMLDQMRSGKKKGESKGREDRWARAFNRRDGDTSKWKVV